MRRHSSSIRLHLAVFGLLVVVPLLAAGGFVSRRVAATERVNMERAARNLVRDSADSVDREIEGARAALFALSTSPNLDSGNFRGLRAQAIHIAKAFPGSIIGLRDISGRHMMMSLPDQEDSVARTLDPVMLEADRQAIATRGAVVSGLFVGAVTGQNFVSVEIPVERDGQIVYLLSLALRPERILSLLQARTADPAWTIGVVDRNDRMIARTRDNERFVGAPASTEFVAMTRGEDGTFIGKTSDGEPMFNAYVRSRLSGWRISAAIPMSILEAPLRRSYSVIGTMAAIGLTVSLLMALLYGRYLTRSVGGVQRLAEASGRGEEVRPFFTGIRELDRVADALVSASSEINHREKKQSLLINELNHRVKNTLATIQSIAAQTVKNSPGLKEFRRSFEGRLVALSNSHNVLTTTNWTGAKIDDLLIDACRPFCDVKARLVTRGEPVELPPKAAVLWGMIFHELATNAAKYGALSTPDGVVRVNWSNPWEPGGSILYFEWKECGGPATAAPTRRGFGSTLIVNGIEHDLRGDASLHYESDGLRFKAVVPLGA